MRGSSGGVKLDSLGVPERARRWVKVGAIAALIVALLVAMVMVVGGGEQGPARHLPGGQIPEGHTPPPGVHVRPEGVHP